MILTNYSIDTQDMTKPKKYPPLNEVGHSH